MKKRLNKYSYKSTVKAVFCSLCILSFYSCEYFTNNKQESIQLIVDSKQQDETFKELMSITNNSISAAMRKDSLAFLILPVQASCPACRNKTIDSITKYENHLAEGHFIIISANGGYKTISGYFQENDKVLPRIEDKLFLDSINLAHKYKLYDKKPTIYYTYNQKAYKMVAAIPSTVRIDLQEFFSGFRDNAKK